MMRNTLKYQIPESSAGALRLHCNEGALPPVPNAERVREYPNVSALEARIGELVGRPATEVVVTAGADGAIDRVMLAFAGPGRRVVVADPTFEMIPIYAEQSGAEVVRIAWDGDFPVEEIIAAAPDVTALVTPDNPTGRTIEWDVVERVSRAVDGIVLLDLAYVEYADEDFTQRAGGLSNVVVTRTFSKAWGLAGLRVGYALAAPRLAAQLRSVGSPYPVSAASAALVEQCLDDPAYVERHVAQVRIEREAMADLLEAPRSQANFVFARFGDANFVADALREDGIEVRRFARSALQDALRIGCPGSDAGLERLRASLERALRPEALIFDMDGVLADVRESYRAAIVATCALWGVAVTHEEIADEKTKPDSNDDFAVTRRMLAARGVDAPLELVTRQFQEQYDEGLWRREDPLVPRGFLERVRAGRPLAVVTGRPRPDAQRFLATHGIADLFDVVICREDAPMKPNPAPVRLALGKLGVSSAWMFGDTVDDLRAARGAGVLPMGVMAPGETTEDVLRAAGAVRVVGNVQEVERWLT